MSFAFTSTICVSVFLSATMTRVVPARLCDDSGTSECGWCGVCPIAPKEFGLTRTARCIYPFDFDLNEDCTTKKLCFNGTCKNQAYCYEGFGYTHPRCLCYDGKHYGKFCDIRSPESLYENFAVDIAVLRTINQPMTTWDSTRSKPLFTITVFVTIGKGPRFDTEIYLETDEGFAISTNHQMISGKCEHTKYAHFKLYPYKLHCGEECVGRLPGRCTQLYEIFVPFPYRIKKSNQNDYLLAGKVYMYRSNLKVTVKNRNHESFYNKYPTVVNYLNYGLTLVDLDFVPIISVENCGKFLSNMPLFYRRSTIELKAKISLLEPKNTIRVQRTALKWLVYDALAFHNSYNDPLIAATDVYTFTVKPTTLEIGTYRVELVVTNFLLNKELRNFYDCYLEIKDLPLVAVIKGGSKVVVDGKDDLILSGEGSQDPNRDSYNQNHLQFSWSCQPNCNNLVDSKEKVVVVKSSLLVLEKYEFFLTVSATGLQSTTASQEVIVDPSGSSLSINCIMNCLEKAVSTDPLLLGAVTKTAHLSDIKWTFSNKRGTIESADQISEKGYPPNLLSISPNTLEEGSLYTFYVEVNNIKASIHISVYKRPWGGTCSISPDKGIAMITLFDISCSNFTNKDGGGLVYEFFDKESSDLEQTFSGRMISSNEMGFINGTKLTGGNVIVYVYGFYGSPTVVIVSVELTPYETSEEELKSAVAEIVASVGTVDCNKLLELASMIPYMLTNNKEKGPLAEKLFEIIGRISLNTLQDVKLGLSTAKVVVKGLTKDENFKLSVNLVKLVTEFSNYMTKTFKEISLKNSCVPTLTWVSIKELTLSFVDVIEMCILNRDYRDTMDEDDITPSQNEVLLLSSINVQESIDSLAEVVSSNVAEGFAGFSEQSVSGKTKILAITDSSLKLSEKLLKNHRSPITIPRGLAKSLENFHEVTVFSSQMKYNPLRRGREIISTEVLALNIFTRKSLGNRISRVTRLKRSVVLFFSENNQTNIEPIVYEVKLLNSSDTNADSDAKVTVIRLDMPKRSTPFIKFLFDNTTVNELRVAVTEDVRPDYGFMLRYSKVVSPSNPELNVSFFSGSQKFLYIGILPKGNISGSTSLILKINVQYSLCLTWVKYNWVPDYCYVNKKSDSNFLYCSCYHTSIFGGILAVPPNEIDPYRDISLFLNVKNSFIVAEVVIVTFLAFVALGSWAFYRDTKDSLKTQVLVLDDNIPGNKHCYIIAVYTGCRIFAGTTAKVGIKVYGTRSESHTHILASSQRKVLKRNSEDWFLIRTPSRLGKIKQIHIWQDNSGSQPDWYCEKIIVYDTKTHTVYTFFVEDWLALDESGFSEALLLPSTANQYNDVGRIFVDNMKFQFCNNHIFGKILARNPRSQISRLDTVIIFMTLTFTTMLLNIAFFRAGGRDLFIEEPKFTVNSLELIVSIQSCVLSSILSVFVVLLMEKSYRVEDRGSVLVNSFIRGDDMEKYISSRHSSLLALYQMSMISSTNRLRTRFAEVVQQTFKPPSLRPVTLDKTSSTGRRRLVICILAWTVCIVLTLVSSFFVLLFGLKYGEQMSKKWLLAQGLSMTTQFGIMSPVKIILVSVLLATSSRRLQPLSSYNIKIRDFQKTIYAENVENYIDILKKRSSPLYKFEYGVQTTPGRSRRKKIHLVLNYFDFIMLVVYIVSLCLTAAEYTKLKLQSDSYAHVKRMVLKSYNQTGKDFKAIFTMNEFIYFLEETLLKSLYKLEWYNKMKLNTPFLETQTYRKYWMKDYDKKLIGPPVLRQLRVTPRDCPRNRYFKRNSWRCPPAWSDHDEERDNFSPGWKAEFSRDEWENQRTTNWKYTDSSTSIFPPRTGATGTTYHGGGYIFFLTTRHDRTLETLLSLLYEDNCIDRLTRVVFLEFTIYSVNRNFFTNVLLSAEHLPFGNYITKTEMKSMRLLTMGSLVNVSFILSVLMLVFFSVKSLYLINRVGLLSFFSKFDNIYQTLLVVLGISVLVFFLQHVHTSQLYIDKFQTQDLEESFQFDEITQYRDISYYLLILLFCCLVLYLFSMWSFGRLYLHLCKTLLTVKHEIVILIIFCSISLFVASRLITYLLSDTIENYNAFNTWMDDVGLGLSAANTPLEIVPTSIINIFHILLMIIFVYEYKKVTVNKSVKKNPTFQTTVKSSIRAARKSIGLLR